MGGNRRAWQGILLIGLLPSDLHLGRRPVERLGTQLAHTLKTHDATGIVADAMAAGLGMPVWASGLMWNPL
ncbi:hypothetical protein GGTG_02074 [Gaeumannomyces tritici R3-111a-1]|uniref:Uncharacterized protein n=1 Tax=Gaeumannomyces tritici (strain R3-111a-1) TaxID=644352 RepID=J3NLC6_GAET3|nr:hypothetical protein GGTG_02074 [Gaeumannomyces tritici R3-111a-1]EJT82100.1 hypothetical protein GGTG_02074 [Gaeumannomyces tritici R3-111a-1]